MQKAIWWINLNKAKDKQLTNIILNYFAIRAKRWMKMPSQQEIDKIKNIPKQEKNRYN